MKARSLTWKRLLAALAALSASVGLVWAATTNYTEPWTSSLDSWAFTQSSCSGTCADVLLSSDGNPADSVSDKITGRSKAETGYWKLSTTWTALGVPSADVVDTVDGQWDDKAVQTAVACNSSSTMGIQIFDSANSTQITGAAVEANLNVAGDTAAWTNHNPTGAVSVSSSNAASSSITLRFNVNPASGNNANAACELRGDNFKLAIVSHTPANAARKRIYHLGTVTVPFTGKMSGARRHAVNRLAGAFACEISGRACARVPSSTETPRPPQPTAGTLALTEHPSSTLVIPPSAARQALLLVLIAKRKRSILHRRKTVGPTFRDSGCAKARIPRWRGPGAPIPNGICPQV